MAFKMKSSSFKQPEWSKAADTGGKYDIKKTTRKNLFGRDRIVEKYYDPETGEKVGKQVTVARGKGDPRAPKIKTKKVNPGLTQSGGVGKIRVGADYFKGDGTPADTPPSDTTSSETDINRPQFAAKRNLEEGSDFNVEFDPNNPRIPTYKEAFDKFKKDGDKYVNPISGAKYDDLSDFVKDAEAWCDEQAAKTNNQKLKEQGSEYGLDEHGNVKYSKSPNKKRGFKMNSPWKNYKKGYYGVK